MIDVTEVLFDSLADKEKRIIQLENIILAMGDGLKNIRDLVISHEERLARQQNAIGALFETAEFLRSELENVIEFLSSETEEETIH
jgi:serine phosphatase RsbU (regulator of sigma subunit)